jgi:DNA-binding response OmpR family regulator
MKNRILLVEDDSRLRSVLNLLLTGSGYLVLVAAHGAEALRILAAEPVDLVITDLIMPEKEGVETILAVRREQPRLPILAMSGGGFGPASNYLSFARSAGACRLLEKPFEFAELVDAVGELLGADAPAAA